MDQFLNIRKAINSGFAEQININELTAELLISKIILLTENPTYRENIKRKSQIFRQQHENHPLTRAIHLIETVIKNNGSYHLQPEPVQMAFYRVYQLDMLLVFLIVFIGYVYIIKRHCSRRRKIVKIDLNLLKKNE